MGKALPLAVGVGFKPQHFAAINQANSGVHWVEVHAENYMTDGGLHRAQLAKLAEKMPVSLHGVGLSLGGTERPSRTHLNRLKQLCDWLNPAQISEHVAWTGVPGHFVNDLLPVDLSSTTMRRMVAHIDHAQQMLGRKLLVENPTHYLTYRDVAYDSPAVETDFLAKLAAHTGCGLLLDLTNVHISCHNLGWSARAYLNQFPMADIGEVHLAGHAEDIDANGHAVFIDNHGGAVSKPVWQLFQHLVASAGMRPTLIEWDSHVPDWQALQAEAQKASALMQTSTAQVV